MKSKRFEILINPDQQVVIDLAMSKGDFDTQAGLITYALAAYLKTEYALEYPPARPRGGNNRK